MDVIVIRYMFAPFNALCFQIFFLISIPEHHELDTVIDLSDLTSKLNRTAQSEIQTDRIAGLYESLGRARPRLARRGVTAGERTRALTSEALARL